MAVSINGETLVITLESGVNNIDWQDVYSDWKDWMLASPNNRKYPQAFRTTGGDPLNEFLDQGRYYCQRNDYGWRVKPPEEDITIYASGNLVAEDSDLPIFKETTGAYTVGILGLQPVTQGFSGQLAAGLEYGTYSEFVHVNPNSAYTGTVYPVGTALQPVNNFTDALTIASAVGLFKIKIYDDVDLNDSYDLDGFTLEGLTSDVLVTIDTLASVNDMTIRNVTLTDSTLDGGIDVRESVVRDVTYVNGHIANCGLSGAITLGGNKKSVISDCYTVDQDNPPTIDMGGSGNDLAMPNYSGLATISNLTSATNEVGVGLAAGMIVLDSTITAGSIIISGIGLVTDTSTSVTYINLDGLINKSIISAAVWDENIANHLLSGTTGRSVGIAQFAGAVHIDAASGNTGSTFPTGTAREPVDNLSDALTIAADNGLTRIEFKSDYTITAGENVSGYTLFSESMSRITLETGASTYYTSFELVSVAGTFTGYVILNGCSIHSSGVTEFYGIMDRCIFNGDVGLSASTANNAIFLDCYTGNVSAPPSIDCNGDGAKLSLRGLTGAVQVVNKTGATTPMFIDLYSARVGFASSVTAGNITVRGSGYIYLDDSTGTTFDTQGLVRAQRIDELWQLQGLDADNPITMTPTGASVGSLTQEYTGDGETTKTVTRQ